jgi:hypothetical protein
LEDSLFDNLIKDDYLLFGSGSFYNNRDRKPECAESRFNQSRAAIKHLAEELIIPLMKLPYIIKDEISGGVDNPNGYSHHHLLISSHKLDDVDKEECADILTKYWHNEVGVDCDFQPFNKEMKAEGVRYVVKVRQYGKIVMNDVRLNPAMKRRLNYLNNKD